MLSFLLGLLSTKVLIIGGLILLAVVALVLYLRYRNNSSAIVSDTTAVATGVATGVASTASKSIFSSIFGTITSVAGGLFGAVEKYIAIGLLTTLLITGGAFYWYYNWSQDKLQVAAANQQKLEDAVNAQRNAFDKLKKDTDAITKSFIDLQKKQNEIQKRNDELEKKFQQYDFQNNALKNRDQTEKDVNDTTAKMLKDLETLTDPDNLNDPTEEPTKEGK